MLFCLLLVVPFRLCLVTAFCLTTPTLVYYLRGVLPTDDDDNDEDMEGDGMGMAEFMEYLHNAAASTSPYSAEMAKKYTDRRKEGLENCILTWANNIGLINIEHNF